MRAAANSLNVVKRLKSTEYQLAHMFLDFMLLKFLLTAEFPNIVLK